MSDERPGFMVRLQGDWGKAQETLVDVEDRTEEALNRILRGISLDTQHIIAGLGKTEGSKIVPGHYGLQAVAPNFPAKALKEFPFRYLPKHQLIEPISSETVRLAVSEYNIEISENGMRIMSAEFGERANGEDFVPIFRNNIGSAIEVDINSDLRRALALNELLQAIAFGTGSATQSEALAAA